MLASREFWQSLGITFYYTAIATVAEMLLGLAIALVLMMVVPLVLGTIM